MNKLFASLVLMASSLVAVHAGASPCESLFRQAYVEASMAGGISPRSTAEVYVVYFDFMNGVQEAYPAAAPIFKELGTPDERRTDVLRELSSRLQSGLLCTVSGPMSWPEVVDNFRRNPLD